MKATILASVLLILLASAECIRWTGSDGIKRSVRVVRSPPSAPYTFEARATRNDVATKKADAIDFLFSVNWVSAITQLILTSQGSQICFTILPEGW